MPCGGNPGICSPTVEVREDDTAIVWPRFLTRASEQFAATAYRMNGYGDAEDEAAGRFLRPFVRTKGH